jgi:hypothetical protein
LIVVVGKNIHAAFLELEQQQQQQQQQRGQGTLFCLLFLY